MLSCLAYLLVVCHFAIMSSSGAGSADINPVHRPVVDWIVDLPNGEFYCRVCGTTLQKRGNKASHTRGKRCKRAWYEVFVAKKQSLLTPPDAQVTYSPVKIARVAEGSATVSHGVPGSPRALIPPSVPEQGLAALGNPMYGPSRPALDQEYGLPLSSTSMLALSHPGDAQSLPDLNAPGGGHGSMLNSCLRVTCLGCPIP